MANDVFDATHPSGTIRFRSSRGGILQHVEFADNLFNAFRNGEELAEGILLSADVSFLEAAMEIRAELNDGPIKPSADVPTPDDLDEAKQLLRNHLRL